MPGRVMWMTALGLATLAVAACNRNPTEETPASLTAEETSAPAEVDSKPPVVGKPLYTVSAPPTAPETTPSPNGKILADPIVIPDCRLSVINKQDVPSQRDGVLLVIGREVKDGEQVPPDRLVTITTGGKERKFRRWQEGDVVGADEVLALLDDRLARDDEAIKEAKVTASKADQEAAEKTRDEARNRYERRQRLMGSGTSAMSAEETDAARLTWQRYISEAISKVADVTLSERELDETKTVLDMHVIRSAIPGMIKTIYKKRGEYVKAADPVFQLLDLSQLRLEGLVPLEYVPRLRLGMEVLVEPSRAMGPQQTLVGHLQEITSVAVSNDPKNPQIVSASEDGTVRVWDRSSRRERRILHHPTPVRAVVCTPPGVAANWCLTGGDDGILRLWDLNSASDQPLRVFHDEHRQAVRCLAFSPDGKTCASGGDDLDICLWDTGTGELRYHFPLGHRAAVTSLHFTPQSELVSAGGDNTLRVWQVGDQGAVLKETFDRRSGEVTQLGVSVDGKRVLFDQGKALRVLSLPEGLTDGVLENPSGGSNFTTLALFSPDARLIVTAGASEGRLQLWRTPTETERGSELRQLISPGRSPATCAAFAPDGSFLVSGTRDRQILVWPVPSPEEREKRLRARITLIERVVESSAQQVRVWAELSNPDGRLLPGTTATMVIPGE